MNRLPPQPGPPEDADERYRRASAQDPSRPSETVRRAVLAHAARLCAGRLRAAAPRWWSRPALFGTLAAAAVAGLLVVPRYFPPAGNGEGMPSSPRTSSAAELPAALPTPEQPARSAPAVPRPPDRYADVQPQQQRADARRHSQLHGAGEAAQPPPVAYGAHSANTADEAAARQDQPAEATRSRETGGISAGYPAGLAARSALSAPAPAPAAAGPTDSDPAAALRRAAGSGDLATLQSLMTPQTDLNARDPEGRTALMLAVLRDQATAVTALLEHGADPNVADLHGMTPLAAARNAQRRGMVEALERHGAR